MLEKESKFQEQMMALVRAFGLHQPDQTPCGQPLSVSEAYALTELLKKQSLSQVELVKKLELEKSTVTRLVQQLEKKGWIERSRDKADGRILLIQLTEAGLNIAEQLSRARAVKFSQFFTSIPLEERDNILRTLELLTEAASATPNNQSLNQNLDF